MADYRQGFADQLVVLVGQASVLEPGLERETPDSRRHHTAVVEVLTIRGFQRVIGSGVYQLNRGSTRCRNLPYLPGALSVGIENDPFAVPGPGRDLGSAGHRNQLPGASPCGADEPDLTPAVCRRVEGDFA